MVSKLIAGLVLIIVLVGAWALLGWLNQQQTQRFPYLAVNSGDEYLPQEYTDPATLGDQNITAYPPGFEDAKTAEDCEKEDPFLRNVCYSDLALSQKNFAYCNSVSGQDLIDNCFLDLAEQTQNADLCPKIAYGAADCYVQIALETNNANLCEKAGFEKGVCLKAAAERDYGLCKPLGNNRKFCNDAIAFNDASQCDNVIDPSSYCFFELARQTNNAELCEQTKNQKDHCYYQIALATNNTNLCNLVSERQESELCIAAIAFNTQNPALCDLAGSEKENCLQDLS